MHRSIILLYVVVSVASVMAVKNFTCIDQQYKGNVPCDAGVYLLEHGGVLSVAGIAVGKDGSVQKAQRIAEEYARKKIADLISVTVASTTESSAQEIRIQNNDTVSTAAKEQFKQYVRSDVKALLRGVRMVANWMSDDETEALVAIAADPAAVKAASAVATSVPTALRAEGGDQVVEVTGLAALVGSNSQAARAAAMQDACKRAVVMAVGVFVDAETATKNNAALQERLYSRTDGFVKKYDVLNETIERLECRVTIRATVAMDYVKSTLQTMGVLRAALGYPKVMCLIRETQDKRPVELSRLANVLENVLGDEGVPFVDQRQLQNAMADMERTQFEKCLQDPMLAAEFGRNQGAEVIMVGDAALQYMGKEPQGIFERTCALVTLKAINASSGKILGTATQNEEGLETTADGAAMQACKRVATVVKREMFPRIVRTWQDEANQGVTLKVVLDGVDQFRVVKVFKDALAKVDGVVSIDQRAFRRDDRRLELDVQYKGKPSTFVDAAYEAVSSIPELAKVEPDQKDMYVRFVVPQK